MSWEKNVRGYFAEREGFETLGDERGFITFKDQGDGTFYIRDLYVDPDFRNSHVASEMADVVAGKAKDAGARTLYGTVDPQDAHADRNVRVLHGYGMKFYSMTRDGQLLFRKEI